MRPFFSKYLALYITGIVILAVILIVVLVQTFRFTSGLAQSLFSTISGWPLVYKIFIFMVDWAEVIAAFAACLVLIVLFVNFRVNRRNRALSRLHGWAKNAVVIMADYRQGESGQPDSLLERYEEIRTLTDRLKANCHAALADARVSGGEPDINTKKAVRAIIAVDEKITRYDESAFEDLKILQHNLADLMISAFESLQHEKNT